MKDLMELLKTQTQVPGLVVLVLEELHLRFLTVKQLVEMVVLVLATYYAQVQQKVVLVAEVVGLLTQVRLAQELQGAEMAELTVQLMVKMQPQTLGLVEVEVGEVAVAEVQPQAETVLLVW
jgi:uncharacterized membrane protein YczE